MVPKIRLANYVRNRLSSNAGIMSGSYANGVVCTRRGRGLAAQASSILPSSGRPQSTSHDCSLTNIG